MLEGAAVVRILGDRECRFEFRCREGGAWIKVGLPMSCQRGAGQRQVLVGRFL